MPDPEHEEWLANQKARKEAEAARRHGLALSAKNSDDEDNRVKKTPPIAEADSEEDDDDADEEPEDS